MTRVHKQLDVIIKTVAFKVKDELGKFTRYFIF